MILEKQFLAAAAALLTALASSSLNGGDWGKNPKEIAPLADESPWDNAIRPITNPTLFDLAVPRTQLHPLFIYNSMPGLVDTTLGKVPLGGDYQVYAVQFEYAFTDRLSLNATKDGYIVFDPAATLSDTEGFANIALGPKYAWLLRPEQGLASSVQLLYEIPSGNRDAWQGEGDGVFVPSISTLKLAGNFQFSNTLGFKLPVDGDAESSMFYTSAHVSYDLCEWFRPLVELNWFHVINAGDGARRFNSQLGGALPSVAAFEEGDLVNWGASNAELNKDFVTAAAGFRVTPPGKPYDFGVAYEIPLTDTDAGLIDSRFTLDMVLKF
jgi:hypothetical protein